MNVRKLFANNVFFPFTKHEKCVNKQTIKTKIMTSSRRIRSSNLQQNVLEENPKKSQDCLYQTVADEKLPRNNCTNSRQRYRFFKYFISIIAVFTDEEVLFRPQRLITHIEVTKNKNKKSIKIKKIQKQLTVRILSARALSSVSNF